MTRYLDGPRDYTDEPIKVYAGESLKFEIPVWDGVVTGTSEYGELRNVSAATIKGILRINKPDGSSDVTRDTSVSGEGAKSDTNSDGNDDAFQFYVADTVTALWSAGTHNWEVEYVDTSTTPDDVVLVAIGRIQVKAKPSEE